MGSSNTESKVVLFTAAQGGVGTTTTILNVAYRLAQAGKTVLIVECNMETPCLEHRLWTSFGQDLNDAERDAFNIGLVNVLHSLHSHADPASTVKGAITLARTLSESLTGDIFVLPAGSLSNSNFSKTMVGLLQESLVYASDTTTVGVLKLLLSVLKLELDQKPDYILIDLPHAAHPLPRLFHETNPNAVMFSFRYGAEGAQLCHNAEDFAMRACPNAYFWAILGGISFAGVGDHMAIVADCVDDTIHESAVSAFLPRPLSSYSLDYIECTPNRLQMVLQDRSILTLRDYQALAIRMLRQLGEHEVERNDDCSITITK